LTTSDFIVIAGLGADWTAMVASFACRTDRQPILPEF
jgi:hypothetical protein